VDGWHELARDARSIRLGWLPALISCPILASKITEAPPGWKWHAARPRPASAVSVALIGNSHSLPPSPPPGTTGLSPHSALIALRQDLTPSLSHTARLKSNSKRHAFRTSLDTVTSSRPPASKHRRHFNITTSPRGSDTTAVCPRRRAAGHASRFHRCRWRLYDRPSAPAVGSRSTSWAPNGMSLLHPAWASPRTGLARLLATTKSVPSTHRPTSVPACAQPLAVSSARFDVPISPF